MDKKIMLVVGAGQISLAITRRLGTGKKILIGDLTAGRKRSIHSV